MGSIANKISNIFSRKIRETGNILIGNSKELRKKFLISDEKSWAEFEEILNMDKLRSILPKREIIV